MIVIPLQSGTLIVRVIVVRLSYGDRKRNVVKHAPATVPEAHPARSVRQARCVRCKPTERTAIADPGYESAVKMVGNPVLCPSCAGDRGVNREDMGGRKRIGNPNSVSRSARCDDDAAQMARHGIYRVPVTPQPCRQKLRMELVGEFANRDLIEDRVGENRVRDSRYYRNPAGTESADGLDPLGESITIGDRPRKPWQGEHRTAERSDFDKISSGSFHWGSFLMELNGGRLERNFIKCRVLSLYAFQYASCAAMLSLSCQKQTVYWHSGRCRERALGSGGPGFLKKTSRPSC